MWKFTRSYFLSFIGLIFNQLHSMTSLCHFSTGWNTYHQSHTELLRSPTGWWLNSTPLKNMTSSVGMIIPFPIELEHIQFMFQENYQPADFQFQIIFSPGCSKNAPQPHNFGGETPRRSRDTRKPLPLCPLTMWGPETLRIGRQKSQ